MPSDVGVPPSRDDRMRVHETQAVIGKVPQEPHVLGSRIGRRRHFARRRVGVALGRKAIADGRAGEPGVARRFVVADRAGPREVFGMVLRGRGDPIVAPDRGRADRGAELVVHPKHLDGVIRSRGLRRCGS